MFIANDVANGPGLHPLESIEAGGIAANQDAIDQAGCLVVAERLGEHRPDVLVIAYAKPGLPAYGINKLVHHVGHFVLADILHLSHGHAHTLDLFGAHVLEDFCGIRFAQ